MVQFANNKQLVAYLVSSGLLETPEYVDAFDAIDRYDFVPDEHGSDAYVDSPLPIGYGQTISQPSTVAFMIETLSPRQAHKILDVGCGSGWTTALLAQIAGIEGQITATEKIPELIKYGTDNILKYDFNNINILTAGEELGYEGDAPYDRILVSAAASKMPEQLIRQLETGGRMVVPIGNSIWQVDKLANDDWEAKEFKGYVFVPLVE